MAWSKCDKCGRRVSDKLKKCPKCGHRLKKQVTKKNYVDLIKEIVFVSLEIILMWLVFAIGRDVLYSGEVKTLFFLFGSTLLLLGCTLYNIKSILRKLKGIWFLLVFVIISCSIGYVAAYGYKGINAFRYENSWELYNLASKYSLDEAKKIKNSINEIFELDDGVSIRNIEIGNFYKDGDEHVLFVDDYYGNYRLKFYVLMNDEKIIDIYYLFNDNKLYLVKDGEKIEEFSYYYAMYIVDSLMGEDLSGLARIEDDVETKVKKEFDEYANTIISYGEFKYNSETDTFSYECDAENMDYFADIDAKHFTIVFERLEEAKKKKVWYYGDASFDYVKWHIEF